MTKEINLFLGDTKDVLTSKTSSQPAVEKTSGSLFDSILSNIKEESAPSKEQTASPESKKTEITNVENKITGTNSVSPKIENEEKVSKNTATKDAVEAKNVSAEPLKDSKINPSNLKETKSSIVEPEKSTVSLLDRMILEAGKKIDNKDTAESAKTHEVKLTENSTRISSQGETKTAETSATEQNKSSEKSHTDISKDTKPVNEVKSIQSEKSLFDSLTKSVQTKELTAESKVSVDVDVNKMNTHEEIQTQTKENSPLVGQKVLTENSVKGQILPVIEIATSESETVTDNKVAKPEIIQENTKQFVDKSSILDTKEVKVNIEIIPQEENKSATITQPIIKEEFHNKNELLQTKNMITKESDSSNIKQEINKNETTKQEASKENITVTQKEVEVKKVVNSEIQTTKTVETTIVKNENVAKELSKIVNSDIETKVNISKEEIDKLPTFEKETLKPEIKETKEKSLLDKLIDETKQFGKNINKEEINAEKPKNSETVLKQNSEKSVDPLVTNMYLSSQKKNLNDASIVKVAIGKQMANDATNVKDIEKSAQFLNLGFEDSEVTVKMQELEKHTKLNILDKLAFAKTTMRQDSLNNNSEIISKQTAATNSAMTLSNEKETTVQLTVSPTNVANIESRIIGARQQMSSLMSDVARNMYLNYKPPVTAFRMNLNPGTLGSIAIIMKNDKENGLTISLNMSNSATLDAFVDNQASLRSGLAKNFNSETTFTLDFNMQQQKDNSSSSNSQQDKEQNRSSHEEATILKNMANSESQESTASEYM